MNIESTPQYFAWDALHSVMVPDHPKRCDRQYVDGERYRLGIVEERSMASHSHYFAMLNQAWANLPEDIAERFPTTEHLRKFALVRSGFYTASEFACSNHEEALRLAGFMRGHDVYAVIVVKGNVITRMEARSQSRKAMSKAEFQQSKERVLAFVANLIGTNVDELQQARSA